MKTHCVHRLRWLPVMAVLAAGLLLTGCPKRPEVGQAGAAAIGPAAAALPSPTPPAGVPPPREPAVTQPASPQEAAVPSPTTPSAPKEAAPQVPSPPAAPPPVVPVQPPPAPAPDSPGQAAAPPGATAPPQAQAGQPEAAPAPEAPPLKDVFFDFDMATIRPDQRPALDENLAWLKSNSQASITVEGHCDERGTPEYNIALGERRAKAVKDYLVAGGVEEARIRTVSFGEERPFVLGHDESAWKWNRRGRFVITQR
jgi:peptidoglycan-associated lipoprotein